MVFTTIFDTPILGLLPWLPAVRHLDDVEVIVIPDRKTPESTHARCRELNSRGLRTTCPTLEEQGPFASVRIPSMPSYNRTTAATWAI
jgi:hypothetical protein